jgi:eukaryotic-like serine/threonine-protein kinase
MEAGGPTGASRVPASPDGRIGLVLQGRYRILSVLAEGGMGTVYQAERLQLGRQVAIKFLHDWAGADPQLVKRFDIEARTMSRLAHPNCVAVIDFGVEGTPYLVMDLVIGKTLRAMMREGVVPAGRALRIIRQVLAGLAHAHSHGIVHRDVKPENILLEQAAGFEDHVRILDFGLAKVLGSHSDLTRGMALGTPNYMAPEQLGSGTVDERTDVYAVGIVLFEMLTGQKPFSHQDVTEVYQRQLHMPPPALRQASQQRGYSATLEAVLLRAMAKAKHERFPTAAAMAAALESVPEASQLPSPALEPTLEARVARSEDRAPVLEMTEHAAPWVERVEVASSDKTLVDPSIVRAETRKRSGRSARVILAAMAAMTGVAIAVASLTRQPRPVPAPITTGPALERPASPPPPPSDVSSDEAPGAKTVRSLLARGEGQNALRLLGDLRRQRPSDPELAALQAQLYFEKFWWSEGAAAYRVALRGDPARARDPVLVGHLISSLQSERFHRRAAALLRELGPPVRPLLEEAARQHESPSVRTRAARMLANF